MLALAPQALLAQDAATTTAPTEAAAPAADAAAPAADAAAADTGAYKPLGPDMIKGQPTPGGWKFQEQYSPTGQYALWMHNDILFPVITAITLFVFLLLVYVMIRFRKSANPVPSKTSHNTFIEVVWTLVPVLILVGIAVPSISLLAQQYKSPPANAVTIKVTGYQWYWGYTYPDNGGFEVISNMMTDEEALAKGLPRHLAVDHRMVVPVGVPLRIQTTGADVIHSFAVPSLWFKLDAVPGRLNEKTMLIEQPGIYYGQCSELCGLKHGYMPIAVEAVPMDQFKAWVLSQGGELNDAEKGGAAAAAAPDAAAPAEGADAGEATT